MEEIPTYDYFGRKLIDGVLESVLSSAVSSGAEVGDVIYPARVSIKEVKRTKDELDRGFSLCIKVEVEVDTPLGKVKVKKHIKP
ncbi:hypothetical protein [Vibrio parahaemolyticus]|uniref:hypothetical protein n=1 Tax=Vibrio parahaemolyticus TaxID=670 RepID=UPI0012AE54E5|nr:hypothetical protein [Vibrio parahaemolyticus]